MRKYLIGMVAALVGALALSSVASADVTSVGIVSNITPAKQDKKVRGPVNIFFQSSDTHTGNQPCPLGTANSPSCYAFPPSIQTSITFPPDLKFTAGNIPDCQLSRIVGQSTASARANCAQSIVGAGGNLQAFSDGRKLNGTVTAFNGAPSGGNASLYLHVEFPGVATKPILNGVFRGNNLTVQIPPVQGSVIEFFNTSLNGKRVVGTNKKTGKKTTYAMMRCSTGKWITNETVTYQNGKTLSSSVNNKCTPKKKK
jgi:hypothetical protein